MGSTFEENMADIEKIVSSMQNGTMGLDDSIKAYERGMKLIDECEKKLTAAEKSLKVIERDASGKPAENDMEDHEKEDGSETVEKFIAKTASPKRKKSPPQEESAENPELF